MVNFSIIFPKNSNTNKYPLNQRSIMKKYYLTSSNLISFASLLIAWIISLINFGPEVFSSSRYDIVYLDGFLIIAMCIALGNCYLSLTGKTIPGNFGKRISGAKSTFFLGFLCLFMSIMFLIFFTRIFIRRIFCYY